MLLGHIPSNIEFLNMSFSLYGLLLGLGAVLVLNTIYGKFHSKLHVIDYLLLGLSALLGARGLFLLHNIYKVLEGSVQPFSINMGGLALYGAIFGLLISSTAIAIYRKIPILKFTDTLFLNFPLAQSIGRWGNYFNGELYGKPTNLSLGVELPAELRPAGYEQFTTFHPVFLYESILNLINWLLLRTAILKKGVKEGTVTFLFMLNYGVIRLAMNLMRVDKEFVLGLETSDLFSVMFIGIAAFGLFILYADHRNERRGANIISYILNAYLTAVLPILLVLYKDFVYIANPYLYALLILSVPTVLLLLFLKLRLINDLDISDRSKRPLFMSCLTIFYGLFYLLTLTSGSILLVKVALTLFVATAFFTIISTFWKISGHMTYLLFAITSITYIYDYPGLMYLYLLVPLVAWARVKLKHHTPLQTVFGTITAMLMAFAFFYLI